LGAYDSLLLQHGLSTSSAAFQQQQPVNMIMFMLVAALAHLAHARAVAATGVGGVPNTAAYTQLATKLESLIHTCLEPNIMPEIARRVSQLNDLPLSQK